MDAKTRKLALTIGAMVIVLGFIIFLIYYGFMGQEEQRNYCGQSDKENDVCTQEYKPVCGWFDSDKVQCIKYPCAQTFSNGCFACIDANVLYWTEGECPE